MASRLWEDVSRGVSPWLVGPPRASYDGLQLPDALSQAPTPFRVEPRPAEPGVPAPRPPPAAPGVPAPRPRPAEPGIPAPRRRVLPEGRVNQPEPEQDLDTPPPPPVIARVRTTLRLESAQPRRQVCPLWPPWFSGTDLESRRCVPSGPHGFLGLTWSHAGVPGALRGGGPGGHGAD